MNKIRICLNCRAKLTGKQKKYCSRCYPHVKRMKDHDRGKPLSKQRVSKACPHCKQLLPISAFAKHRRKNGAGKYYLFTEWICKSCFNANMLKNREKKLGLITIQLCKQCGEEYMPNRRGTKYCSKECLAKSTYHPILQKVMQFLDCDQCGIEFMYHSRNKHICDNCKLENDQQRSRESARRWRAENPEEEAKRVRISAQRREHRKRQLPATLTVAEWENACEHFDWCCAYCGYPSDKLHQEHFIPLSKGGGYTKDNIVPACPECNLSKSDAMPRDWLPEDVYVAVSAFLAREYVIDLR